MSSRRALERIGGACCIGSRRRIIGGETGGEIGGEIGEAGGSYFGPAGKWAGGKLGGKLGSAIEDYFTHEGPPDYGCGPGNPPPALGRSCDGASILLSNPVDQAAALAHLLVDGPTVYDAIVSHLSPAQKARFDALIFDKVEGFLNSKGERIHTDQRNAVRLVDAAKIVGGAELVDVARSAAAVTAGAPPPRPTLLAGSFLRHAANVAAVAASAPQSLRPFGPTSWDRLAELVRAKGLTALLPSSLPTLPGAHVAHHYPGLPYDTTLYK